MEEAYKIFMRPAVWVTLEELEKLYPTKTVRVITLTSQ
jgi:hypothetical protein